MSYDLKSGEFSAENINRAATNNSSFLPADLHGIVPYRLGNAAATAAMLQEKDITADPEYSKSFTSPGTFARCKTCPRTPAGRLVPA